MNQKKGGGERRCRENRRHERTAGFERDREGAEQHVHRPAIAIPVSSTCSACAGRAGVAVDHAMAGHHWRVPPGEQVPHGIQEQTIEIQIQMTDRSHSCVLACTAYTTLAGGVSRKGAGPIMAHNSVAGARRDDANPAGGWGCGL